MGEDDIDTKDLKNVAVHVNSNGVSIKGKNDKGEDIQIKVNEDGAKITTTDSTGKNTLLKKK